jgi:purine-binding chemotaxis protein CheW
MGADASCSLRGRYLLFHLADQTCAIPVAAVEEIVPMAELAQLAGGPSFLAGYLNVGGDLIAVISLRRLFKLAGKARELYTPIVILKSTPQRLALEVDAVREIADVADEDAVVLGDGCVLNDFALAAVRREGNTVLLLSPERLLLEEERQRVAELADMARDRRAAVEAVTA